MARKVLSIIIGNEITKVCEISYKKKYKKQGIRVYNSISFPTPADIIEDGFIKDKEALRYELRMQLKNAKMKSKRVIFSVASSKIANREVVIPYVNDNRIMDIIHIGASEYFPVDMKDYILSCIILEKKRSDRREKALAKKQAKSEKALAKKQEKLDSKARKKSKLKIASETANNSSEARLPFKEDFYSAEPVKEAAEQNGKKEDKKLNKINKKHIRLSVYAAPSNLIKNYYNFADMMDLNIVSIDYSGNSSYQMLKRQANEGTNVFIQLNEQDTVVSIMRDNVLILQRTIGYGISTLTEMVMEQSSFKVQNEKEAIELLQSRNLLEFDAAPAVTQNTVPAVEEAAAASEALNPTEQVNTSGEDYHARRNMIESLQFLTNSITRMLDYYKNNNRNVIIKKIYLSGFGIRIQGIDRLFSEKIGIDNLKLEKLNTVSSKKRAKEYRLNPSEFMSCVGSVLKPVNFVPTELVVRKQRIQTVLASILLIILCLGGTAALCYFAYDDYRIARNGYDTAAGELSSLPDTSAMKEDNNKAALRLEDLEKMEGVMQGSSRIKEVIGELEKNMLTSAKLQNIEFADTGVVMKIIVADNHYGPNTLVAMLLMQLKNIPLFDEVQDSNMSVSEDGEVNITISCTYK